MDDPTAALTDERTAQVRELIAGAWMTQAIHHAVRLGVFEALFESPSSTDAIIASRCGAAEDATCRLLRSCATLGLVEDLGNKSFKLTAKGLLLCRDTPGSLSAMAMSWGEDIWLAFESLGSALTETSGQGVEESRFAGVQSDPVQSRALNLSMAEQSHAIGHELVKDYDFSRFARVLDVGGGYGGLLRALLESCPQLRGSVFDFPMIAEAACRYLAQAQISRRAEFIGGDFFASVPAVADLYVLKYVIHDWADEQAVKILKNVRAAAGPQGTIVLIEQVLASRLSDSLADRSAARLDLFMLMNGGKERTQEEYRLLGAAASLQLREVRKTISGFSVLEFKAV
jgi:C-methyltransferase